jgi:signal transduction histidine kinase
MRSITTNKLAHAYLERPARDNYIAIALTITIIILSVFWIVFHIGSSSSGTAMYTQAMYGVSALLGALWAFRTAYMGKHGPVHLERQHQLAWFLIGLGLSSIVCGRVISLFQQLNGSSTFPGVADIFFTLLYPLISIAILLMPSTMRFRARTCLDILTATLSLLGAWWFFVLSPTFLATHHSPEDPIRISQLVTGLAYFGGDILLALTLILFFLYRSQRLFSPAFLLLGIALLLNLFSDLAFGWITAFRMYQSMMPLVEPVRYVSYLLIGLSGLYQYAGLARKHYTDLVSMPQKVSSSHVSSPMQSGIRLSFLERRIFGLLIHLPLTLLLALTVYSQIVRHDLNSIGLVVLTAVVGTLMTTRYILANHENEVLLLEREQRHLESEHLRRMVTQLTEILSEERLRECIVSMVIDELNFDAVMLLLVENLHPTEHPQIQVYAAAMPGTERPRWSFQGDNALEQLASSGKVHEVSWDNQHQVPPEIRLWCQEQRINEMVFLSLTYQGRILGSLGVTCRSKIHLNRHDISLLTKYTEQVTAVIEHARLYNEAREHEEFSRAMATIATRLNAAAVEPAEIGMMICKEGANILRADYAFLYRSSGERHLKPLAAYMRDLDAPLPLHEWPLIHSYEYEAQALHALQPVLLHIPLQELVRKQGVQFLAMPKPEVSTHKSTNLSSPHNTGAHSTLSLRVRLAQYYIQTVILAPIVANGEPIGLLIFARSQPPGIIEKRPFTSANLPQTQDFVEQAAVPFINAQLYQDLQMAHQRLQELDQLKDQFMVTASHELRTPLTAVQGYIELLAQFDEQLPGEQRRDFLQKARRGCEELVVLLGNVMDASRLEIEAGIRPALLKRVSLQETVESIMVLIEPQITQEQREVYIHVQPRLFALADPPRLRQVLMNISVNALKYSLPQTPLAFSAYTMVDQDESFVVISISDKGKGIAPHDQSQLFQRFVRLESDVNSPIRGSGLGLYISRRLIEAMGGKIWIESKGIEGEGSTFHIRLPAAR